MEIGRTVDELPDQPLERASARKSDAKMTILSQFASGNMIYINNNSENEAVAIIKSEKSNILYLLSH